MEEQGYIEIKVDNAEHSLTPKDVDINDIRSLISDIEVFLYPTREEKKTRPLISFDIQPGSSKNIFYAPISTVILFNGLVSEISKRNQLDFLDYKRQEVIDKFQKIAKKEHIIIEFKTSLSDSPSLIINTKTNFELIAPAFFESELYLYGEVYQEGGIRPNIHISTKNHGKLIVSATKEQIIEGEQKTYKVFGLKVKAKKNLIDGKLSDLKLIEFINYKPEFNIQLLQKVIERASVNLNKISNLDNWIDEMKTDGI